MKYFSRRNKRGNSLRPPDLYEFFVDNFWFITADLENQKINDPLRGRHEADIVIVGGGYTGLSAAYHLREKFPDKEIFLIEGACCGYGASGRNGGFCIATDLIRNLETSDPEILQKNIEISFYGLNFIKRMVAEHGVECDLEENGMLGVALDEKQARELEEYGEKLKKFGLEATLLRGDQLQDEIHSPRFMAGLVIPHGAILNPAKLAREMKRVVENCGVVIKERSVVTRITPSKVHLVETELGEIRAPVLVLAVNAYAHKLGFFKDRVFPVSVFQIATEPLSRSQWDSIGWQNRQGLYDMRTKFSYLIPSTDGRIIMGGSDFTYYANDAISSGNDMYVTRKIKRDLFSFFPQLEGLKIDHLWGGTTTYTLDRTPSVGVMGEDRNLYYAVGLSEGVPTTQTFGRIIADLMAGEENNYTKHYTVNRDIPYAGPTSLRKYFVKGGMWVMENLG
jgi:gamma-glutamylputrescine oxidase